MLAFLRYVLAILLVVIFVELGTLGLTFSPSYSQCERSEATKQGSGEAQQTQQKISRFSTCMGISIDQNANVITAIATAVIAAFTITLWLTSRGQLSELKRSIESADEASRRELRSYPGIRGAQIWFSGNVLFVRLKVFNHSPTPAYSFRYAITAYSGPRNGKVWAISMRPKRDAAVWDMTTNSDSTLQCNCTIPTIAEQNIILAGGGRAVFIVGCVSYRDIFGAHHFIKFRYRTIAFTQFSGVSRCDEPEAFYYRSN